MDIETLKARVYFVAGQLEEAKKIFNDAVREIERVNKENAVSKESDVKPADSATTDSAETVHAGEPASI